MLCRCNRLSYVCEARVSPTLNGSSEICYSECKNMQQNNPQRTATNKSLDSNFLDFVSASYESPSMQVLTVETTYMYVDHDNNISGPRYHMRMFN